MNTKFSSSGLPISSANVCKNHTLESLFFCLTTANAIGKILSFPSLVVTDNICPPNLPFKWQPYNPTSGLHPPPPQTIQLSMHCILGCLLGSIISVCRITLLPTLITLIISAYSLSFLYYNLSSPSMNSLAFLLTLYT